MERPREREVPATRSEGEESDGSTSNASDEAGANLDQSGAAVAVTLERVAQRRAARRRTRGVSAAQARCDIVETAKVA